MERGLGGGRVLLDEARPDRVHHALARQRARARDGDVARAAALVQRAVARELVAAALEGLARRASKARARGGEAARRADESGRGTRRG